MPSDNLVDAFLHEGSTRKLKVFFGASDGKRYRILACVIRVLKFKKKKQEDLIRTKILKVPATKTEL